MITRKELGLFSLCYCVVFIVQFLPTMRLCNLVDRKCSFMLLFFQLETHFVIKLFYSILGDNSKPEIELQMRANIW